MNKAINFSSPKNRLLRLSSYAVVISISIMAVPVAAEPLVGTFDNTSKVIKLSEGADIFDAAIISFTDVDTSSVELEITKAESESEEQAFNAEVTWEVDVGAQHIETNDRSISTTDENTDALVRTSVTLRKRLWDKAQGYSIDSARNNIRTAQINQLDSQQVLIESVALAYLDYLSAKDLVASSQKRNEQFLNLKNKITAMKKEGGAEEIDLEVVDSSIETAQSSLLEEKTNLEKAKIKLRQLTYENDFHVNARQSYFTAKNDISLSAEDGLIDAAMKNNMELLELYSGQVSLQKNILSKRAESGLKLDFRSTISQEWLVGDTDQDTLDASLGLNMQKSLYSGGRINNQVKLAKLELLRAEREINQKKREIISDISTLSVEFSGAKSSYKSLLKMHQQLKKRVAIINADIASDKSENLDVFDVLDEEVELNNSIIRLYYGLLKTKVEVMKLTGDLNVTDLNQLRALLMMKRI